MEKRRTVMICDDEADLLKMYATALNKHYHVLTADSGRACIEKYMDHTLRGKKIDVLLLDYKLGDSTGDDVACKIRELDGTKTILLTAYELERDVVGDLKSRNCIVDLVSKPVSMKVLFDRVQQAITSA